MSKAAKINKKPQTEVEHLKSPELKSHLIRVTKVGEKPFHIPVIDVRDGEDQRENAKAFLKTANYHKGSKYMKPSYSVIGLTYNDSTKKFLSAQEAMEKEAEAKKETIEA